MLSGLMEVLAFVAGRVPIKKYERTYAEEWVEPPGMERLPSNRTFSGVGFENGDILVCAAYDEGDYSDLTPGAGVQVIFYAITPQ